MAVRSLAIGDLLGSYSGRCCTPAEVVDDVLSRIAAAPEHNAWITLLSRDQIEAYLTPLANTSPAELPLYGIPFAIKDNIDLAGVPTTAACSEFAYTPGKSASVVQKLIDAGAIPIGKTNLDQFATGLVGTRSPHGPGKNAFDPAFISGGSSAGSAIAVAMGLVSFSLGTDTAGSGRVPAGFNNLIGLKPSCGLVSTRGVVPACRSLDCVSIFSLTAFDAQRVLRVAQGFDAGDHYSRVVESRAFSTSAFRFGVPRENQLDFFGDTEYARLFAEAVAHLTQIGGERVEIDFEPFLKTARLLYEGPWVAERYAAIQTFIEKEPEAMHPVTRKIILPAVERKSVETFQAQYRLQESKRQTEAVWRDIDVLVTPTAGTIYRIGQVDSDPIRLNSNLGTYTNFLNLLDLAAVSVPHGFRKDGLPFGATLVAPAGSDEALLRLANRAHRVNELKCGLHLEVGVSSIALPCDVAPGFMAIAVCGAHMDGLPLNHQLRERNAYFIRKTQSSPRYRLYALAGGPPFRPGMVKVNRDGAAIELEVWAVPSEKVGSFLAGIPAPLGLGKVQLVDGSEVTGFVCDATAVEGARDITDFGGWRSFQDNVRVAKSSKPVGKGTTLASLAAVSAAAGLLELTCGVSKRAFLALSQR
jgi:allophanate hydrolase